MSMKDLYEAFDIIDQYEGKSYFTGSPSEKTINDSLQALHIALPSTYMLFTSRYGAGSFFSNEIYGFIDKSDIQDGVPDVVWVNMNNRERYNWPDNYLIIGESGDGAYYVLDLEKMNIDNECQIVEIEDMNFNAKATLAKDFGEFLLMKLKEALVDNEV